MFLKNLTRRVVINGAERNLQWWPTEVY
jgi:hypothetical protein